jgi:hypothetical protein
VIEGDDAWYESEELPRQAMVAEVQRLRRRAFARPLPVFVAAAVLTGALVFMLARRKHAVEAEVILALTEGSMSPRHTNLPVDQLRAYVTTVLMPRDRLAKMIEARHLYTRVGVDEGLEELRTEVDVSVWKNTFGADNDTGGRSARIGVTYLSVDPILAYGVVRDVAQIIIDTAAEERKDVSAEVVAQVTAYRNDIAIKLANNAKQIALDQVGLDDARLIGDAQLLAGYDASIDNLLREQKRLNHQLEEVATSQDSIADRISAAGLDMTVEIVEEHRPEANDNQMFVLILVGIVAAVMTLIGSALVLGAFDARVHDTDDIARLGLPVLGHVPGFAGDQVGSLAARGYKRARVPLFLRWRSHR